MPADRGSEFRRIVLVYDDRLRPDTTGGYCLRALQALGREAIHLRPDQLSDSPDGADLLLCVDDGLDYPIPATRCTSVFWAIDTHLDFARALHRARGFDLVFAAQKEGAERLLSSGIRACEWLPLACDSEVHRKLNVEKQYDVGFVGREFRGMRQELLSRVREGFPRSFIGQAPHTEMAGIYSRARIAVNCSLANDLNMRVFEAMSCGALLVTNRLKANGQEELFRDRVHLVEYETVEEALALIDHYLEHEDERERIAKAGHEEVVTNHTYRVRMERLLERVEQWLPEGGRATGGYDWHYFHWPRPDLVELVPAGVKRVLDVGCAAGVLGEQLKRRGSCEVVGIECDPGAAREAQGRLDRVINADIESLDLSGLGAFGAIVCGDVLEHLRDPAKVLRKLREALREDGLLVASFPNARHMEVVQALVEGNWTYEQAGLLDREHLRFFTRRSAEQLLEEAGFAIGEVRGVPGKGHAEWRQLGRPGELRAGRLGISELSAEEAGEFFVGQWLITAKPAAIADFGLTSIIIVTWDELPYTQRCLESIRKHTPLPHEIIVVDNGSSDGTPEWLEAQSDVRLLRNPRNLGFAAAANQGLRAARGESLVLLNNDTLVTPGWLRRLLGHLHRSPDVGLVGPVTNFSSGEQQIPVTYHSLAEVDGFAWELGRRERGRCSETDRLVGFCLAMKREAVERIGLLDERFELGCFEDDDLCRRASQAGYRLLVCRDAFIHHFGGRSFICHQLPFSQIMEQNRRRFAAKWQLPPDYAKTRAREPAPANTAAPASPRWRIERDASGALLLAPRRPAISLCMIVRDEEAHLADCLQSSRPFVDEMVVVDTGSTDRTMEIAKEMGAKVHQFPWQDSFSAARNASIEHATGDWIFWMDADDVIDPESGAALRWVAEQAGEAVMGFVAQVRCPPAPGEHGETVVDHVKLFRNRPGLRFEFRIHEQILPSIRRAGGEIVRAPIRVSHVHYDQSAEGQARKRERDRQLLELDLREYPDHPFIHFNVGMTAAHESDWQRAVHHLRQSIELAAPHESHVRKSYALLASCHRGMNDAEGAITVCQEGRRHYPDDAELLFNEALAHQLAGRLVQAAQLLEQLLALRADDGQLGSVDVGIYSYKARHNLGAIYQAMGKTAEAKRCWREAIGERPDFLPGWLALVEVLARDGDGAALGAFLRQARQRAGPAAATLLEGRAAMLAGDLAAAEGRLREAIAVEPNLEPAHRFLSHVLLQRGERDEVEGLLRRALEADPDDGEAHHNLASLMLEKGRVEEAAAHYQRAVALRPGYRPSQEMLEQAMRRLSALSDSGDRDAR
jgi:GT2 family glycosyltransferase/tetratricopeptide (TPR) repeat protein/2-polyprenyl-3-methyl-5-hydroxy-6-metoxy-1,4-benzoquinol methylase